MRIAIFTDKMTDEIQKRVDELRQAQHKATIFSPENGLKPKSPEAMVQEIEVDYPNFGMNFDLVHTFDINRYAIAGMLMARKNGLGIIQTMYERPDLEKKALKLLILDAFHANYLPHPVKVGQNRLWTLLANHANFADAVVVENEDFAIRLQSNGMTSPVAVIPENAKIERLLELYDSWC